MKRGRLVRLDYRAHNPEVVGSNPAPASIVMSLNCCNEAVLTFFESACFRLVSVKKSFLEVLLCLLKTPYISSILAASKRHIFNVVNRTGGLLIAG